MKVQRSHLRIAVVFLVAAVLYNVWSFMGPTTRTGAQLPQQPLIQTEVPPAATGQPAIDPATIPAPPEIDMAKAPSAARDPFLFGDETRDEQAQAARDEVIVDPTVRSILFSSSRKAAIVDSRMVSIGDSVGSLKVADIERDAVIFATAGGDRRRVTLHKAAPPGIRR